jgi:predicted dehydrogenase
MMSKITTIGLIGVTHPHSAAHTKTLNWMDEITDVPIFDADKSALGAFKSASGSPKIKSLYTDLDALLEREDVPVVFVCLRNEETPDVIIRAAEAGKHIITEKPVARHAKALEPALEAVKNAGVKLTVCFRTVTVPYRRKSTGSSGRGFWENRCLWRCG